MQIAKRTGAILLALFTLTFVFAGCSKKVSGPQKQVAVDGGVAITASIRPGLPQDSGSYSSSDSAQTGDNTLIIQLRDAQSEAPIPDANVTAAPSTDLTGDERAESGRAQGDGIYFVPIRFGVPDDYKVIVTVQQPGQRFPLTVNFTFSVS